MSKHVYRAAGSEDEAVLEVPDGFDPPQQVFVPMPTGSEVVFNLHKPPPEPLNERQALKLLRSIPPGDRSTDYERAHSEADEILLRLVSPAVREAYEQLRDSFLNWPTG